MKYNNILIKSRRASLSLLVLVLVTQQLLVTSQSDAASPTYSSASDGTVFNAGDQLLRGEGFSSPNNNYRLVLQNGDGNVVLYDLSTEPPTPKWASQTQGTGANSLRLQHDGNLVLRDSSGSPIWSSGTTGSDFESLRLFNDGSLVLFHEGNKVWSVFDSGDHDDDVRRANLLEQERIFPGEAIYSPNGTHELVLEPDGNLVIYDLVNGSDEWSTDTQGDPNRLVLQNDGNLVLYGTNDVSLWASHTRGEGANELDLTNDGELRLLNPSGYVVWKANSYVPGEVVHSTIGGLNETNGPISVFADADAGDYHIVAIGASSDHAPVNEPIDAAEMTNQGFQLVGVRGAFDSRIEVWIREHNGSNAYDTISIPENDSPGKDSGYSITTIDGDSADLNFNSFNVKKDFLGLGNDTAEFTFPSGSGFAFVAFFFDDGVEVTNTNGGELLYNYWERDYGDWDGIATIIYQPGVVPPSHPGDHYPNPGQEKEYIRVVNRESAEKPYQWTVVSFNSGRF